jgi:hypothetical protein
MAHINNHSIANTQIMDTVNQRISIIITEKKFELHYTDLHVVKRG